MRRAFTEFLVGIFMLMALGGLMFLAYQVSGFSGYSRNNSYLLTANFDTVGGLKVNSPVKMAGVRIGQVDSIGLDPRTYRAVVHMRIAHSENQIPFDSSAKILTEGLIGANYISLTPGFDKTFLKSGDEIEETHSALVLENLIGQFLFSAKSDKK